MREEKKAVALKYDSQSNQAPIISAVGKGHVADKIIEKAKENDIPIVQDESVSSLLAQFSVGDNIPPSLYEAVAQILIFISEVDSRS